MRKATTALVVLALGTGTSREGLGVGRHGPRMDQRHRHREAARQPARLRAHARGRGGDRGDGPRARPLQGHRQDATTPSAIRGTGRRWPMTARSMGVLPLGELPQTRARTTTRSCAPGGFHPVQGGLPALCHRRRLAADREGLRLLARRRQGCGDGGHARGARLVRGRPAVTREADLDPRHRRVEPLRRRRRTAAARLVHFNGWGNFPNPSGYTTKRLHAYFRGRVREDQRACATRWRRESAPYRACDCSIEARTQALLLASLAEVGAALRPREGRRR